MALTAQRLVRADQLLPGRGAQLGPVGGGARALAGGDGARAARRRGRAARAHRDQPGQPDRTGARARRHRGRHPLRAPPPARHPRRRGESALSTFHSHISSARLAASLRAPLRLHIAAAVLSINHPLSLADESF